MINNRDLLKEKLGVTDQQLDEFKNSEDLKKANEYFKENVVQAVSDNTKETVTIFRVYSDLVSTNSKIIFAFLIIVLTGIIALLQKSFAKTIKTFGINFSYWCNFYYIICSCIKLYSCICYRFINYS